MVGCADGSEQKVMVIPLEEGEKGRAWLSKMEVAWAEGSCNSFYEYNSKHPISGCRILRGSRVGVRLCICIYNACSSPSSVTEAHSSVMFFLSIFILAAYFTLPFHQDAALNLLVQPSLHLSACKCSARLWKDMSSRTGLAITPWEQRARASPLE